MRSSHSTFPHSGNGLAYETITATTIFSIAGATAWLLITANHHLEKIEVSRGAQLVISGSAKNLTVDSVTDDNTGHLYLLPPVQLQINGVLSPCSRIFHGAELVLSDMKPNVSMERTVDIYGTLSLAGDPSVLIGKQQGVVTLHPGSSPSTLNFGELIIEPSGHLRLLNYDTQSPESCRWTVSTTGSRFTLSSSSKMDVDCPFNLTGDQMTIESNALLKINGNSSVSYVSMNNVSITGTFEPGVLSMLEGWKTLKIERYGHFRFFPYGDVRLDAFYTNGNFYVEGVVYIRGRDPAVTGTIEIDQYGRAMFDLPLTANSLTFVQSMPLEYGSHGRLSLNGSSLVHADIVVVDGTWQPKKLKIEPGWKELTVEPGGSFHFDPVGVYNLDKLTLDGDVKSLNAVELAGLSQERIPQCKVGSQGVFVVESADLTTILCQFVAISGTLRVGKLNIEPGWNDLTVNSGGTFQFDPVGVFNLSSFYLNGDVKSLNAVELTGLFQERIRQCKVGSHGVFLIESATRNLTTIRCQSVTVSGSLRVGKLKIEPGWNQLTVNHGGTFHFDPVGVYNLDNFYLDGNVKALNAVELAGLSQERILQCEVRYHGLVLIDSGDLTTIRCQSVLVSGTLRVGNLFIGSRWDFLHVNGSNGKFYFETSDPLNINQTRVSGLMQTGSAVGPSAPLTGDLVTIESPGTVSIHYQAQPSVIADGAVNSTLYVTTVQVSGLFKLGSLYLVADNLRIGSSGRINVDGGGATGGRGPGAGTQHYSGGSGASHGGRGGRGAQALAQALIYGDIFSPGGCGSGGGNGYGGTGGGRGGGRISLQISQTLDIDGTIQMNGLSGRVIQGYSYC